MVTSLCDANLHGSWHGFQCLQNMRRKIARACASAGDQPKTGPLTKPKPLNQRVKVIPQFLKFLQYFLCRSVMFRCRGPARE